MFPLKRVVWFAMKVCCLTAIIVGVVWNLRFGIADFWGRRNQPDSTRLAMRLMPANGAYPAQLAEEIYATDPGLAKSLLRRAVELNGYDPASWIQLGLLCEAANDLSGAEDALLRAASVDLTFLPSWSLANFYFRRENVVRFWYWAEKAVQMTPDDATALFRLAWYVSPNAAEIENRLRMKRPAVQGQFIDFLIVQSDAEAVAEATAHLLGAGGKDSETVLRACEWLIEQKRPDLALTLWNGLAAGDQISYAPLAAGSEDVVTNGRFDKSPLSRGFDWHLRPVDGVSSFLNAKPNALGFEFSGNEADSFLLMNQAAPVQPQKNYSLTVDYATFGIPAGSGIEWLVTEERTGAELARTGSLSAEHDGVAQACFTAPAGAAFVNLSMLYQRQPGTVRVEGKLSLRRVRLTMAKAGDCKQEKISTSSADSPAF